MKTTIFSMVMILSSLTFINTPAAGQSSQLNPGDKIRVTYTGGMSSRITGSFSSITDDSLRFVKSDSTIGLPLSSIQRVDVSVGKKTNEGRGAAIGAAAGGFTLGLIALASDESCGPEDTWCIDFFSSGDMFLIGLVAGAAGGAFVGLIAGGLTQTDKWQRVPLEVALQPVSLGQIYDAKKIGVTVKWHF